MRALLFHNILWSHYKGSVFSALHARAQNTGSEIMFAHMANTSSERVGLAQVDTSYHQYPYEVLFPGATLQSVSTWQLAKAMIGAVQRHRPDIVLIAGYEYLANWLLLGYCVATGRRRVMTLDSTQLDHPRVWYKELIKKTFLRFFHGSFCYGTRAAEYLLALGMSRDQIVERCQACPPLWTDEPPARDWVAEPCLNFLYVGRLAPEKSLDTLLDAFALVSKKHDISLKLVGSGPLRNTLEQQVSRLGLGDRVTFTGAKSLKELPTIYADAYCFVLPSTSEPWGLVINEAFSSSCPAIVSHHCGCEPDLISQGKTGYTFRTRDSNDLASAMEKMLADRPRRAAMGSACRKVISAYTPASAAESMFFGLTRFTRFP